MSKVVCCLLVLVFCSTICFAVPSQPTDKSSFRVGVPAEPPKPGVPYAVPRQSYLSKPLPTNKWFNSVILPYNAQGHYDLLDSLKMFAYPQVFKCDSAVYDGAKHSRGLMISYPKVTYTDDGVNINYGYDGSVYKYSNNIKVSGYGSITNDDFIPYTVKMKSYSDFSSTIRWEDDNKWMQATIGQGFVFSYFECSPDVYPVLEYPYPWNYEYGEPHLYKPNGEEITLSSTDIDIGNSDRIIYETRFTEENRSVFYAIFFAPGTKFKQVAASDVFFRIFLDLPSGQKYFSIGLLPAKKKEEAVEDLDLYYKYAYNFVTDTKVDWKVNNDNSTRTDFNLTVTKKRTDIEGQQDGTLFCLFPHQYNNLISHINFVNEKTFSTLRGTLKLTEGTKFSTKTNFVGKIVPFFEYDVTDIKDELKKQLIEDNNGIVVKDISHNPYRAGKIAAKLANMLPVADNIEDSVIKESIRIKLRSLLENWFTYTSGEQSKYFAYDDTWGGLLGVKDDEFSSHLYNDHHFHFGYFIYASAILASYDDTFVKDYGQIVNLLIKDIANTNRNDKDFPYMRNFDFYESHSWANGMGGQDDRGIDQESSSEAMNTWSAIYLWGLVTQNKEIEKLGIYLYSNEYEGIKYYYFNTEGDILKVPYKHNSVGILRGGNLEYNVLFSYPNLGTREIKGIQLLPMTPAMSYVAYDRDYAEKFYAQMKSEAPNNYVWNDIWTRFRALTDPQDALKCFTEHPEVDEGGSKSFTYHFINFFLKCGTLNFNYKADTASYMVLEKNDKRYYCAYNPTNSYKNVSFYSPSGENLGYITVGAKSFSMSSVLKQNGQKEKFSVYPIPYKPRSGGKYDADGISFSGVKEGDNIKIFNIAGEKVFEKTVSGTDNVFVWNGKNGSGNEVASGIYIYYVKTSGGNKKGKLAIER